MSTPEKEKKEAMEVAAYLNQVKATDEGMYNKLLKEGARISDEAERREAEDDT